VKDLHILPKVRDSWSYLYVEHAKIDQDEKAIAIHDERGKVPVPCSALMVLLLGPGTTVTHAAIRTLAEHGCLVQWVGEEGVRFYARGEGETRSSERLLRQALLWSSTESRLAVARAMYLKRFPEVLDPRLTLQQLRGREGVRVRDAYAKASRETGMPWSGRSYQRNDWKSADPINRALSAANSCLYGICHAAIVSAGYSPALGFIHTGKMLSFVYDVADLYKADLTVPLAFRMAAEEGESLERRVRQACRDAFREGRLLKTIIDDIDQLISKDILDASDYDTDEALPGQLWDPEQPHVVGGVNFAERREEPMAHDDIDT
jgi:CRISPR-associated protein Cas1